MSAVPHAIRTALLAGALTLAPVTLSIGQGISPCVHEARFGLASLARLQSAQLHVVNLAQPPDPFTPPDPCRVSLNFMKHESMAGVDPEPFRDASGMPIQLELVLEPGQSAMLELASADAFRGSREQRVAFRAAGLFTHTPPPEDSAPPDPCAAVVPSLEIYHPGTGRTQIFTNPLEIFGFNPQPEPPG